MVVRELFAQLLQLPPHGEYIAKLTLLERIERLGVPNDLLWMFYLSKGSILIELQSVHEGLSYLRKALSLGREMHIFQQRCILSAYLMALHYVDDVTDKELSDVHILYSKLFPKVLPFSHNPKKKKLRVGYLCSSLSSSIVAKFIGALLSQYSRDRYEVFLYDIGKTRKNTIYNFFLEQVSLWRDLSTLGIEKAAQRIYEDEIDILFDTVGHTEAGITLQIAAHKPAPVQVCGIGYFDTTGLTAMDYFLGDTYCDPPDASQLFSEKLLRLPYSHLCYSPLNNTEMSPGQYWLKDPIVFGSFNNFSKITDSMLALWGRVLKRVPGSRLLLKNVYKDWESLEIMRRRAMCAGIPAGQLDVRPATNGRDYMAEYMDVDIALDTYPYPGGGTTCDALYMGVPVISLYGSRHGSRFGYSILSNVGIGELAASTPEEYVEKAVSLASDSELLTLLHHNLRDMMRRSPVMNGKLYIHEIENIYEEVWEKWLASAH